MSEDKISADYERNLKLAEKQKAKQKLKDDVYKHASNLMAALERLRIK